VNVALAAGTDALATLFESVESSLPGSDDAAVRSARRAALVRFQECGFPTARLEEWKKTDVSAIAATPFDAPASANGDDALARAMADDVTAGERVVFINGVMSRALTTARVRSVAASWHDHGAALALEHLRRAAAGGEAFDALHAAFVRDGAIVDVSGGTHAITILHLTIAGGEAPLVCPWTIVRVTDGADAVVTEVSRGTNGARYWSNARTEIALGEGARLQHVLAQAEGDAGFHTARVAVTQGRDSRYTSITFGAGARLSRTDLRVTLDAPGAECDLFGLYAPRGSQHVDYHTTIDHAAPGCTSRELYHGILDDAARGVFIGRIIVRPDAQHTNARQTNRNLLLSDSALVDTQPQLEIFANDVRCAHGATVGHMSADALFYLRTRGLAEHAARALLIGAFASAILDRAPAPARAIVDRLAAESIPGMRELRSAR
jgi:Fe-S cluster assembly protein SufD